MWRKNVKIDCRLILFLNTSDHVSCLHEILKVTKLLNEKKAMAKVITYLPTSLRAY